MTKSRERNATGFDLPLSTDLVMQGGRFARLGPGRTRYDGTRTFRRDDRAPPSRASGS